MTRPRILLLFGTRYGHTAGIAGRLAAILDELGYDVDVRDAAKVPLDLPLVGIDGVIIAASVIFGRHQRAVERFVRSHHEALDAVPSAFLSVSGAAASLRADAASTARRQLELFVRRTGWQPRHTLCVAGAIAYTAYPRLVRWMLRAMMARADGPTDTSRDHDFTDWAQLREFVAEFTTLLPRAEPLTALTGRE